jgi:hypothetical protein
MKLVKGVFPSGLNLAILFLKVQFPLVQNSRHISQPNVRICLSVLFSTFIVSSFYVSHGRVPIFSVFNSALSPQIYLSHNFLIPPDRGVYSSSFVFSFIIYLFYFSFCSSFIEAIILSPSFELLSLYYSLSSLFSIFIINVCNSK